MFFVSIVNYLFAILIEDYPSRKKLLINLCLVLSLLPLAYFKYAMFVLDNLRLLFHDIPALKVLLPAGISFYTFQGLAYTADVYFGKIKAERGPITFLLFKAFFPQLVAGPIERSHNLLKEVRAPRTFNLGQFFSGIDLLFLGYLKKLVVADNAAMYVNMIFDLKQPSTLLIMIGSLGFGVQILADFSAYTDIARGVARLIGFELLENFNHPYISKSPSDFWRRWHMSLSNCIRDYLYIPLGGSRVPTGRWLYNLFIVWFICGLWHGAAWNFIIWGLYWGSWIAIYRFAWSLPDGRAWDLARILWMNLIITVGWLIFRIDDLRYLADYFSPAAFALTPQKIRGAITISIIFGFYAAPLLVGFFTRDIITGLLRSDKYRVATRIFGYSLIGLLIALFAAESSAEFLYFQF